MVEKNAKNKKPVENQDPELAMREQCDAHGEFKKGSDGCLTFEDYRALRWIIARQAYRSYKPMKDAIEKKRLEAFKADN